MSYINAKNITSDNITVTNLTVTNINGVPYSVNPCSNSSTSGYYVPCPDCNYQGSDVCDCGESCDYVESTYVPDECDCFVPCNNGGGSSGTGPTGAAGSQGVTGVTGPAGADGTSSGTGATGPTGTAGSQGATGSVSGVIAISSSGFEYGGTVDSEGFLQFAYSIGGGTGSTPGLQVGTYSDIFTSQTIDLGSVYPDGNFGNNWTAKTSTGTQNWSSVAVSSSGQYQTALVYDGYIYTSSDYGNNWAEQLSDASRNWSSNAISSTGIIQTAVVD